MTMKSLVTYIRKLIGLTEDPAGVPCKRHRVEDDFSSDDDDDCLGRHPLKLSRTEFPVVMSSKDNFLRNNKPEKLSPKVRYVPIKLESGFSSTSTPKAVSEQYNRFRTVPVKLMGVTENGPSTQNRKPRMHTPVKPVVHAVIEDDDDNDEDKITWIETNSRDSKKPTKIYIEDENDSEGQEDDVVFVKKIESPKTVKPPYKIYLSKNNNFSEYQTEPGSYSLSKKFQNHMDMPARNINKFRSSPGVVKSYKKPPVPVARWMKGTKSSHLLPLRQRLYNGNGRSTLSEVFNLDEKKNYEELIKRVTGTVKNESKKRPVEINDLAQDFALFRNTLRDQKKSLNDIKLFEKDVDANKSNESTSEYDPVTVASINSSDSEVEIVPSRSSTSSVRIEPLNTLKDSYKENALASNDWLTKLEFKYRKKTHERKEQINDVKLESDIISKINYEQRIAQLERKLKYDLSLPISLDEVKPAAELPQLTAEQEKLVKKALGPGPQGQLLVEKFNLKIHRRDIQTLAGTNWLNDEVINFYMNLLMQRSEERKDLPKVYATNTFFYPKLMQSGQAGLKRWTRKVDIFAHDLMVVPVHLGVHWCLSLVHFKRRRVEYLDSMGGKNPACLAALLQYLRDEHKDKKGQPFDDSGWTTECLKDIPHQMNGSDCGMFACTFAEFSARGAPYTFSQQHMPYLRHKAALEILQGKLLI